MPVDHHGPAPIIGGPVIADRETEFVGLARRLSKKSKGAHGAGTPALHFFLHAGVGHDKFAVVQHVVADQPIEKIGDLALELGRFRLKLRNRVGEAMRHLYVLASELLQQLHIVIAGNAQRGTGLDHAGHKPKDRHDVRAAIDQIAEKYGLTPGGGCDPNIGAVLLDGVAEGRQQFPQFIEAAVNIANDVERAMLMAPIRPHRLPLDRKSL